MTNANTSDALPVNRTFKSTLFIMLFEDKKNLLRESRRNRKRLHNIKKGKMNAP